MRIILSNMKRLILIVALGAVVTLTAAPGASANPGTAGAGSSESGPLGHTIRGSGSWAVGVGGQQVQVPFECLASAGGPAVTTNIRPPHQEGCVLKRNGVIVARAQGGFLFGPTYGTAGLGQIAFLNTTSIVVCWRVWAGFADGDLQENASCTNVSLL